MKRVARPRRALIRISRKPGYNRSDVLDLQGAAVPEAAIRMPCAMRCCELRRPYIDAIFNLALLQRTTSTRRPPSTGALSRQ